MAREQAILVFLVSGVLIAAEAGMVGLVAGYVIQQNWKIDPFTGDGYLWFVALALLALVKRSMDTFVDSTVERESGDDRFKRLIREVLDERAGPGFAPHTTSHPPPTEPSAAG